MSRFLSTVLALALLATPARAGSDIGYRRSVGIGGMIGDPTAITAKFYVGRHNALDTALAFGPETDWMYVHLVYLWHPSVLAREPGFDLDWHIGVGGVVTNSPYDRWWWYDHYRYDEPVIGVRTPIGLDFNLARAPLQFFGDVAANTYIVPETAIDLGAALGLRVYF
jgi:hypothetical protein